MEETCDVSFLCLYTKNRVALVEYLCYNEEKIREKGDLYEGVKLP